MVQIQRTITADNEGCFRCNFNFRTCLHGGRGSASANFSHISLENALKRLDARQGSPPTRSGGIAFYHVNGSCQAIPANRSEINRENMAARGELFLSYH